MRLVLEGADDLAEKIAHTRGCSLARREDFLVVEGLSRHSRGGIRHQ